MQYDLKAKVAFYVSAVLLVVALLMWEFAIFTDGYDDVARGAIPIAVAAGVAFLFGTYAKSRGLPYTDTTGTLNVMLEAAGEQITRVLAVMERTEELAKLVAKNEEHTRQALRLMHIEGKQQDEIIAFLKRVAERKETTTDTV